MRIKVFPYAPPIGSKIVSFGAGTRTQGTDEVLLEVEGSEVWYISLHGFNTGSKLPPYVQEFGSERERCVCILYRGACVAGLIDLPDSFRDFGCAHAVLATNSCSSAFIVGFSSFTVVLGDLSSFSAVHELDSIQSIEEGPAGAILVRGTLHGEPTDMIFEISYSARSIGCIEIP